MPLPGAVQQQSTHAPPCQQHPHLLAPSSATGEPTGMDVAAISRQQRRIDPQQPRVIQTPPRFAPQQSQRISQVQQLTGHPSQMERPVNQTTPDRPSIFGVACQPTTHQQQGETPREIFCRTFDRNERIGQHRRQRYGGCYSIGPRRPR